MVTSKPLNRCLTVGETRRGISRRLRLSLTRQTAHTLIVKDLRLRSILRIDAVELEGEALSLVLRVGNLDYCLGVGRLCSRAMGCVDNDILLDLRLEKRTNACDHANTHCIWLACLRRLGWSEEELQYGNAEEEKVPVG